MRLFENVFFAYSERRYLRSISKLCAFLFRSTTRYLALDVINACESEVDIEFATDKLLTVQPKDICRFFMFFFPE